MSHDYIPPALDNDAFNCPHCNAYSHQMSTTQVFAQVAASTFNPVAELALTFCQRCSRYAVWVSAALAWPPTGAAPLPNQDLPEPVRVDFLEARAVAGGSPRSCSGAPSTGRAEDRG